MNIHLKLVPLVLSTKLDTANCQSHISAADQESDHDFEFSNVTTEY